MATKKVARGTRVTKSPAGSPAKRAQRAKRTSTVREMRAARIKSVERAARRTLLVEDHESQVGWTRLEATLSHTTFRLRHVESLLVQALVSANAEAKVVDALKYIEVTRDGIARLEEPLHAARYPKKVAS